MTESLYDIYLSGKLLDGTDANQAQKHLAILFKLSEEGAARLFDGKPHLIKRGAKKEDALKYKAALHKIGVLTVFKPQTSATEEPSAIAGQSTLAAPAPPSEPAATSETNDVISLAPPGTEVLKPEERSAHVDVDIDTSSIKMASAFTADLLPTTPPPPAPDTSHLSVAAVGTDLGNNTDDTVSAAELDLSHMTLAPPGADLEEIKDERPPLNIDVSAITLAPAGTILVEPAKKDTPSMPDIEHLQLEESK